MADPRTTKKTTRKATATKRTSGQAKKVTQQAQRTTTQAERTARSARKTGEEAGRTLQGTLRDGAYVVVGAGDQAVATLRQLPKKAAALRAEGPQQLQSSLKGRARSLRANALDELDELAARGRSVVSSVAGNPATRRAVDQSKTAQSHVKAATTSVRKAAEESAEAVETAADSVGSDER